VKDTASKTLMASVPSCSNSWRGRPWRTTSPSHDA
jgi:hypothetical protein